MESAPTRELGYAEGDGGSRAPALRGMIVGYAGEAGGYGIRPYEEANRYAGEDGGSRAPASRGWLLGRYMIMENVPWRRPYLG